MHHRLTPRAVASRAARANPPYALFVSLDLPDEFTEAVTDLQAQFDDASGLNFTDPKQTYSTLKFLVEVD